MKISLSWLKKYVETDRQPSEIAEFLTFCGLEVESMEVSSSVKGGLQGLVVGEVKALEKHPDADRLSITKVDIGTDTLLNIVCGASNVAAGQKVVVATIGAILYPASGEPFEIKKSKIRGQLSEGMICAEDEIGLGTSHDGIMVLDRETLPGTAASDYFNLSEEVVFEIGLTPNRADAASHIGVARDLLAILNVKNNNAAAKLNLPSVDIFEEGNADEMKVEVEDVLSCPRYSGLTIKGIEVKESPAWLKDALKSIGIKPINNVVDVTNFVLHETGQPLHAFDREKISSNIIRVKKFSQNTKFITLDGIERVLGSGDLVICNDQEPLCIAGVFGGLKSGITHSTKSVFLESACFDPISIRKTSRAQGLKTDASFRFERGTDPNITVYALKRAAILIKEVAGGTVSSPLIDQYPHPVLPVQVPFSYDNCERIIGKKIEHEIIKNILHSLEIEIVSEGNDAMLLAIPTCKVDVKREIDVIEEILRIYGYNNIEIPSSFRSSLSLSEKPDRVKLQRTVSGLLSSSGFYEIICNSLTASKYFDAGRENNATILNPLSSELDVMRQSMLYSGLESIAYNVNRKQPDLKFYEFGKTYHYNAKKEGLGKYREEDHLSIFLSGNQQGESWNAKSSKVDFFYLKGIVHKILDRISIKEFKALPVSNGEIAEGLVYESKKGKIAEFGLVAKEALKLADVSVPVYYASFNWNVIETFMEKPVALFREIPKFPGVRRDLALLLDKGIAFERVKDLAYQTEKNLLKQVNLFDVYEGEKLEKGKKSYAVSFTLRDDKATLTDKQIEKTMEKLMSVYKDKLGATIR
jgi:phenylalanyl-tRNA synthetase beta chain